MQRLEADSAIRRLIGANEVIDGVVPVLLRAGEQAEAKWWFEALAPRTARSPQDLRMLLMAAWVARGEMAGSVVR